MKKLLIMHTVALFFFFMLMLFFTGVAHGITCSIPGDTTTRNFTATSHVCPDWSGQASCTSAYNSAHATCLGAGYSGCTLVSCPYTFSSITCVAVLLPYVDFTATVRGTITGTPTTWPCPATQCNGCTYFYNGVSCPTTVGYCTYGSSQANSASCGASCVAATPTPTPTAPPSATCTPGWEICVGNEARSCNSGGTWNTSGTNCSQYGSNFYCTVVGLHSVSCLASTPVPTSPPASYTCQQCSGGTCSTYTSGSPCATNCNNCSGSSSC